MILDAATYEANANVRQLAALAGLTPLGNNPRNPLPSAVSDAPLRHTPRPNPSDSAIAVYVAATNYSAAWPDGNDSDASSVAASFAKQCARSPTAPAVVAARYDA